MHRRLLVVAALLACNDVSGGRVTPRQALDRIVGSAIHLQNALIGVAADAALAHWRGLASDTEIKASVH